MLAQRYGTLKIHGIDVMPDAVVEAAANFSASPWSQRLSAQCVDFNEFGAGSVKFDLVVSNPPFFTTTLHSSDVARKAARHGVNLGFVDIIRRCSDDLLSDCGRLCMISPAEAGGDIEFQTALNGMRVLRRTDVFTRADAPARRILWMIGKSGACYGNDSLLIGSYAYKLLTAPFYL